MRCFVFSVLLLLFFATPARGQVVEGSLMHGGFERHYRLYVPQTRAAAAPVVIALHGGFGDGSRMVQLTRGAFDRVAERDGFLVVYPDGIERHWNDGRRGVDYRAHRDNVDDVGFVADGTEARGARQGGRGCDFMALVDRLVATAGADPRRVYVTGISNGAMMTLRLGCERAARIAVIAPVAGALPEALAESCKPARPLPVLMIHGAEDALVPWKGGEVRFGRRRLGRILSVPATIARWAAFNRCAATPQVAREPERDARDGTRVRRERYEGCRAGAEVVLLAVEGGGHTWPNGQAYMPERVVGRVSRELDAAETIWEFCRRHAIPASN